MNENLAVIEGILFLAGNEGIELDNVKFVLNIDENSALNLLKTYKDLLQDENRGLMLLILGTRYKLTTKPQHFNYYEKLVSNPVKMNFSNASLETLAIIAYNQPITRVEVESIRGVNSDGIIRNLLAKSLLKESGRRDTIGKPMQYSVTNEFMDYFNLKSLDELPKINDYIESNQNDDIFDSRFKEE